VGVVWGKKIKIIDRGSTAAYLKVGHDLGGDGPIIPLSWWRESRIVDILT